MPATAGPDRLAATLRVAGVRVDRIDAAPWIDRLELRLGFALPRTLRAFVTRYAYDAFDRGGVTLFANRGDGGDDDLVVAALRDPHLSAWLTHHRLVQIGRPDTGAYDPVCVELPARANREARIVRLDHEAILQQRDRVDRCEVGASLADLFERVAA